jgi:hypothetical protein
VPVLPIGQDDERNAVASVMVHPRDDVKREQLLAKVGIQYAIENDGAPMLRRDVEIAHEAPGWEAVKVEWGKAAFRGSIAGTVLSFLYAFDQLNVSAASLRKAFRVISWGLSNGHLDLTGGGAAFGDRGMPLGEAYVRDSWKLFAPASHLWAAQTVLYEGRSFLERPSSEFPTFLAHAEWLRRWGEGWGGPRQAMGLGKYDPRPALSARETWTVPEDYPLRELPSLSLAESPSWLTEALAIYQAA